MTFPRLNIGVILIRELRIRSRRGSGHLLRIAATSTAFLVLALTVLAAGEGDLGGETGRSVLIAIGCLGTFLFGFGACLSSSDSIGSERRERTLGLLMLTPLRPAGILLGKFCSINFQFLLCLLAIVPILSLPLFSGGVTPTDVLCQALNIFTVLLLGSATGFLSSVLYREVRSSSTRAIALLLACFVLPPLPLVIRSIYLPFNSLFFSLSGPVTLPFHSAIPVWTPLSYSIHVGSLLCFALLILLLALRMFRIRWKRETDPLPIRKMQAPSGTGHVPPGTQPVPADRGRPHPARRSGRLSFPDGRNPYFRLTLYLNRRHNLDRMFPGIMLILFLGVLVLDWYVASALGPPPSFVYAASGLGTFRVFSSLLLQIITLMIYWHVCAQSPQRIRGDRDAGMLELILTTPLSGRGVITGLRNALACSQAGLARALALCTFMGPLAGYLLIGALSSRFSGENLIPSIWATVSSLAAGLLVIFEIRAIRIVGIAWGLVMKNHLKVSILLFLIFFVLPYFIHVVGWMVIGLLHYFSGWMVAEVHTILYLLPRFLVAWYLPRVVERRFRDLRFHDN